MSVRNALALDEACVPFGQAPDHLPGHMPVSIHVAGLFARS